MMPARTKIVLGDRKLWFARKTCDRTVTFTTSRLRNVRAQPWPPKPCGGGRFGRYREDSARPQPRSAGLAFFKRHLARGERTKLTILATARACCAPLGSSQKRLAAPGIDHAQPNSTRPSQPCGSMTRYRR